MKVKGWPDLRPGKSRSLTPHASFCTLYRHNTVTPWDVRTLNVAPKHLWQAVENPLILLCHRVSLCHVYRNSAAGNHNVVLSSTMILLLCIPNSFPQHWAHYPTFITNALLTQLPPQPSMPSPSDIAVELYGLDNSLCLATRRRCDGGTALSSRPCGAPPWRMPTRIMESSCMPTYQTYITNKYRDVHCGRHSSDHRRHQRTRLRHPYQCASLADDGHQDDPRGT